MVRFQASTAENVAHFVLMSIQAGVESGNMEIMVEYWELLSGKLT
jgi:hypothetical protein